MLEKVLLCTDGSDAAYSAINFAARLFKGMDCRVTLFMVVEQEALYPPIATDGMLYPEVVMPPMENLGEVLEQRARSILEGSERPLREAGIQVEKKVMVGNPASDIIAEAEGDHYDMVIMGRHGHGFFKNFLIGSVSDRVVRHASCPVLVVH